MFEDKLEDNLFELHDKLVNFKYKHGDYESFKIYDPKIRIIHKAQVIDRVVHTLAANELERLYKPIFIKSSYACIKNRGIHKALYDLVKCSQKASINNKYNFWYVKCDIRKFFNNIDQIVLWEILNKKIKNKNFLWLIKQIIVSHNFGKVDKGLPLGNFTSQWLANIYLNELDYFVKHKLKIKYYLRYADDFIFFGHKKTDLLKSLCSIIEFLDKNLKLKIHENKIVIKKCGSGMDFVGYKVLPHYVIIRKRIKKKMINKTKRVKEQLDKGILSNWQYCQTVNSYLGWLKHCNGYNLTNQIIYFN